MKLARALNAKRKDVISLVGGGGKTTAMFLIARELVEEGWHVVTTTTTRIFAAQIRLAPFCVRAGKPDETIEAIRSALREHMHVLVIGNANEEGKAFGVEPTLIDQIIALPEVDAVINEADGSRMRPLKAPGEHEPVIPSSTSVLVPVVGIDAVGAKLDVEHVHRPERVAALAGLKIGDTIEAEHIAAVMGHPEGGLKGRPPSARVVALVNKARNVSQMIEAREIAAHLLRQSSANAVAIGQVNNVTLAIAELHTRVSAIVLAAGGSTRMKGSLKQLLPWGDATLVRHTVEIVNRAKLAETIVIVGNQSQRVERELGGMNARIILNPDWEKGRSSSIRAGVATTRDDSSGALFVNADQPFLTSNVIDTILLRFFQTLAPIVVPRYAGKTGSPVLFGREFFQELSQLEGEEGGRHIIARQPEKVEQVNILNDRAGIDVDTLDDYQAAVAHAASPSNSDVFSTIEPDS